MVKRLKPFIFSYIYVFFAICFILLLPNTKALAQVQIVTDPKLNDRLNEFQQNFDINPPAVLGAVPFLELKGNSGKLSFTLQQKGRYDFHYGSVQFLPTSPISANRFFISLAINQVDIIGDAVINIAKGKNTFDQVICPESLFAAVDVIFTTQVEVAASGELIVGDGKVDFDPNKILANLPCLQDPAIAAKWLPANTQVNLSGPNNILDLFGKDLSIKIGEKPKGKPRPGTLNLTNMAIQNAVKKIDSSVSIASTDVAKTNCTMVTANASSACGVKGLTNVKNIFLTLSNISTQTNPNNFKNALQSFIQDLKSISSSLSPFGQKTLQKFIDDLSIVIDDGKIDSLEKENLVASFYNLVLAAGINNTQLTIIQNSLLMSLSALADTTELQTNLVKLSADVQPCLRP